MSLERKLHYIYEEEVKKMPFALNANMSSEKKKAIENRVVEHFASQGCNCCYENNPIKK